MAAIEDLEVWKRASRLCVDVYRAFAVCKDYGFKDQITRSALSVPSNVAEGAERGSDREFARFLRIAKGSAAELRTQLHIAYELDYLSKADHQQFVDEAIQISRMLHGLIGACADPE